MQRAMDQSWEVLGSPFCIMPFARIYAKPFHGNPESSRWIYCKEGLLRARACCSEKRIQAVFTFMVDLLPAALPRTVERMLDMPATSHIWYFLVLSKVLSKIKQSLLVSSPLRSTLQVDYFETKLPTSKNMSRSTVVLFRNMCECRIVKPCGKGTGNALFALCAELQRKVVKDIKETLSVEIL